jgi:hypothetical protein
VLGFVDCLWVLGLDRQTLQRRKIKNIITIIIIIIIIVNNFFKKILL